MAAQGRRLASPDDLSDKAHAEKVIRKADKALGRVEAFVNDAAARYAKYDLRDISGAPLRRFVDIDAAAGFSVSQAALDHLGQSASLVNAASFKGFKGDASLVDYSTTRDAITAFTCCVASQVVGRGVRADAAAPGPVWTPFIPGIAAPERVGSFGSRAPMGRPGEPREIESRHLFLASNDGA